MGKAKLFATGKPTFWLLPGLWPRPITQYTRHTHYKHRLTHGYVPGVPFHYTRHRFDHIRIANQIVAANWAAHQTIRECPIRHIPHRHWIHWTAKYRCKTRTDHRKPQDIQHTQGTQDIVYAVQKDHVTNHIQLHDSFDHFMTTTQTQPTIQFYAYNGGFYPDCSRRKKEIPPLFFSQRT